MLEKSFHLDDESMNAIQQEIVAAEQIIEQALRDIKIHYAKLEKLRQLDPDFVSSGDGSWYEDRYDNPRARLPRYRKARPRWQSIMQMVHYLDKPSFNYSDLANAIHLHKFKIADSSMRVQMYKYVKQGYILRLGDGEFKLTSPGLVHFNVYRK